MPCIGRNERTTSGNNSTNRSASSIVLNRPRVIRNEPRALIGSKPKACNTCEGWPA